MIRLPFNFFFSAPNKAALRVHEENNSPFISVTNLVRLIEVSHWGNIAVEEYIDLKHTGANLKGSFSRFDYQRQQDGYASVKSFKVTIFLSLQSLTCILLLQITNVVHLKKRDVKQVLIYFSFRYMYFSM